MFFAKEVWTKEDDVELKKILKRQFMDFVKEIQFSIAKLKDKFSKPLVTPISVEPITLA